MAKKKKRSVYDTLLAKLKAGGKAAKAVLKAEGKLASRALNTLERKAEAPLNRTLQRAGVVTKDTNTVKPFHLLESKRRKKK